MVCRYYRKLSKMYCVGFLLARGVNQHMAHGWSGEDRPPRRQSDLLEQSEQSSEQFRQDWLSTMPTQQLTPWDATRARTASRDKHATGPGKSPARRWTKRVYPGVLLAVVACL